MLRAGDGGSAGSHGSATSLRCPAVAAIKLIERLANAQGHVNSEFQQPLELLKRAAEDGSADAQATLGRLLYDGILIGKDEAAALRWFSRAGEGGNAFAQMWLGDVLYAGKGVLEDKEAAAYWYEKAARQGEAPALAALAADLVHGRASDNAGQHQAAYDGVVAAGLAPSFILVAFDLCRI